MKAWGNEDFNPSPRQEWLWCWWRNSGRPLELSWKYPVQTWSGCVSFDGKRSTKKEQQKGTQSNPKGRIRAVWHGRNNLVRFRVWAWRDRELTSLLLQQLTNLCPWSQTRPEGHWVTSSIEKIKLALKEFATLLGKLCLLLTATLLQLWDLSLLKGPCNFS